MILERVIKEVPNLDYHFMFLEEMNQFLASPYSKIGQRAVELLENSDEIKEFMKGYIDYISEEYKLDKKEAEHNAKAIVGYSTGFVSDEQANIWFNAIFDITHPVMGRERPFIRGKNAEAYYVIGESEDEEIRNFLKKSLCDALPKLGFNMLDKNNLRIGHDNPKYFSLGFYPLDDKIIGGEYSYLYLSGVIMGLNSFMNLEIGKSCKLCLEAVKKE